MDDIKSKMESILEEMGFKKVIIGEDVLFKNIQSGHYHRIDYIKGFESYVIESAENYDEAKKNLFEDSGLYPIVIGEEALLEEFRKDLVKYYLKD